MAATAQLLTDLAEDLVSAGVEVCVVTGRTGYSDGRDLGPARDSYRGIDIYRVGGVALRRNAIWSRYASYIVFWVTATVRCLGMPRYDVVVPLTTPPLLSCLAVFLKSFKGCRVVCWSMDVYPELGVLLGALAPDGMMTRLLSAASSWSLKRCDAVVALGEHMAARLVKKGIQPERVVVLPPWENPAEIMPLGGTENPFRRSQGLDGKFVVLYSGNLGAAHDVETVLLAAERLVREEEIVIAFAGGGSRRRWAEEQAHSRELMNVRFVSYQSRERLRFSLAAGDIHLVTLRSGFEGLLVPSKFVAALAAGRPIIFVGPGDGEIPDALQKGDCGIVIEPGDPDRLVDAVLTLRKEVRLRERMGRNARILFEREYTRRAVTARFAGLLNRVLQADTAMS